MFNFSKTQPLFGLDISAASLKAVEFKQEGKSVRLQAFSHVSLPKAVVINDAVTDMKTFAYSVRQLLEKPQFGRFETDYAAVSLPESKSFIRVIEIPKMSDAEAEAAVPFEAESFIPLPIDQVCLDWQKVEDRGDKMSILIIATPKEFVEKHLEALDEVKIRTVALEVESQSLSRAIVSRTTKESALIVDIDAYRTSLIMVENGGLQFSSTVPIAGNAFTEALARSLGVASVKAEEIKRKVGIMNTPEYPNVKTALIPVLNNLTAEMRNVLKFHSERSQKPAEKIILAGGGGNLKGLPEVLTEEFFKEGNLRVEPGNPWKNLEAFTTSAMSPSDAISYSTAIGLALRNIIP